MKKPESLLNINLSPQIILFIIIMFGLGIRLFYLGRNSFWLDEANSLRVTLLGQQALWAGQSESYHPPLFY